MNEKEKKAIEELEEFIKGPCETCKYCEAAYKLNRKNIIQLLNLTKKIQKENEKLKENNMEYKRILDLADNRIYRKKYLEERRKEELNLLYPDSDEIYQRYYELKQENEKLKNKLLDTLEGQKVIEEETPQYIKENYIPKQKLKDIIDRIDYDVKKTKEIISKNTNINASYRKNDYQIVRLRAMNTKSLDIKKRLQELLEKEE